jgi:hypothetical protein
VSVWKSEKYFVELDDDEFLFQIRVAVEKDGISGDGQTQALYDIITQRTTPRVHGIERRQRELPLHEIRHLIAERSHVADDKVILLGDAAGSQIGFRLFGTDFRNYAEALRSPAYGKCTGLVPDEDTVGQEESEEIVAIVLE